MWRQSSRENQAGLTHGLFCSLGKLIKCQGPCRGAGWGTGGPVPVPRALRPQRLLHGLELKAAALTRVPRTPPSLTPAVTADLPPPMVLGVRREASGAGVHSQGSPSLVPLLGHDSGASQADWDTGLSTAAPCGAGRREGAGGGGFSDPRRGRGSSSRSLRGYRAGQGA